MKKFKAFIVVLLASLVLSACSSAPEEATTKVLRVAAPGDVLTLDSVLATDGFSFEVISAFQIGRAHV